MKALLIGGTGVISFSVTLRLIEEGWEVTLLNRGRHALTEKIRGRVRILTADIHDESAVAALLKHEHFDAVCNFIVYTPEQAQRDIRLFAAKTQQYVFISSASAYHKPVMQLPITEDMPLHNPYWLYSHQKAQCEEILMQAYRENGFPVTIVRPSHTYCEKSLPVQIHGGHGPWVVIKRMMQGKSVPVACDGNTLWTVTTAEDFAVYFCALLGNEKVVGEAFHITSNESLTWNAIYQTIAKCVGGTFNPCYVPAHLLAASKQYDYRGSLLGDKAHSVIFDNRKVQRFTGIKQIACTPFHTGCERSVQYFLAHPEAQIEDPAFEAFCDHLEQLMENARNQLKCV